MSDKDKFRYLRHRAAIIQEMRRFFTEQGYLEVETPLRVRSPGTDVHIDAFASEDRYLITSPEFHMKRLLAAGHTRIYQICRCFRRGEHSELHNSEFTMLEFYAAGMDLAGMMQEVENLIRAVAQFAKVARVSYRQSKCDLLGDWERISVEEAFRQYAGWSPAKEFDEDRFYFDLVDKVERQLGAGRPTILYHYPPELAMLAHIDRSNRPVARRFELYLAGIEIANAFEELTDPKEQRHRFADDLKKREAENKPLYPIDEIFLSCLSQMPPCSGIAVGVDRLVMLLGGGFTIYDVIAFPDADV